MNKQDRIKRSQYLKAIKKSKKKLLKASKEWMPYDWSYSIELFLIAVEGMRDYYSQTYNVCAQEDADMPTRKEMCDQILVAYNEYLGCADWRDEAALWDDFCDKVKKYLLYLWD